MFYKYRLHEIDGSDAGEVHYAFAPKPGEEILTGHGRKLRVIDVVESRNRLALPRGAAGRAVWGIKTQFACANQDLQTRRRW